MWKNSLSCSKVFYYIALVYNKADILIVKTWNRYFSTGDSASMIHQWYFLSDVESEDRRLAEHVGSWAIEIVHFDSEASSDIVDVELDVRGGGWVQLDVESDQVGARDLTDPVAAQHRSLLGNSCCSEDVIELNEVLKSWKRWMDNVVLE